MNKNIGLALSGGGSKGLAHVGALQFFEENNIKFNTIAGTSVGSIVGGLYSCGKKPVEILEFFIKTKMFSTKHLTFSYQGFVKTHTLKNEFIAEIGDPNIEDLDNNIQIVATNLLNGNIKIFEKGSLINAILASSSYPGVFTPMKINNVLYSDGGMVNNYPIDLLTNKVDASVGINLSTFKPVEEEELSNMFDILARSFDIIRNQKIDKKGTLATVNLSPTRDNNLGTFDTDTKVLEQIFETGYFHTSNYFKENPAKLDILKSKK